MDSTGNAQRRIVNFLRISVALLAWTSCPAEGADAEKTPADSASHQARAVAFTAVKDLGDLLKDQIRSGLSPAQRAHCTYGAAQIERFLRDPARPKPPAPPGPPDGSAIGMGCGGTGSIC